MAHYKQIISEELIKNLTGKSLRVYSSTGSFCVLQPTNYKESDSEEIVYIVNDGGRRRLETLGIKKSRLFFASCPGIGRDGKQVWILYPYDTKNPRLFPYEGY